MQSTLLLEKKLISSKIFPKLTSGHKPILLKLEEEEKVGPVPFRFNPLWILQEDFQQIVSNSWSKSISGTPSFAWKKKIKRLKHDLKAWAKLIKSLTSCRIEAQKFLENHQQLMESLPITESIHKRETELQKSFFWACKVKEYFFVRIPGAYTWLAETKILVIFKNR